MIKITTTALVAVAMLMASSAFAGDKACCAKGASKADSMACANPAALNLADKDKIETGGPNAWPAAQGKQEDIPRRRKTSFQPGSSLNWPGKSAKETKKSEA
jgi:hypothetical protein